MSEHEQMITDCEKRQSKLTDWEQGFIQSLNERLGNNKGLTEKQAEKLEVIWERVAA